MNKSPKISCSSFLLYIFYDFIYFLLNWGSLEITLTLYFFWGGQDLFIFYSMYYCCTQYGKLENMHQIRNLFAAFTAYEHKRIRREEQGREEGGGVGCYTGAKSMPKYKKIAQNSCIRLSFFLNKTELINIKGISIIYDRLNGHTTKTNIYRFHLPTTVIEFFPHSP